MWTIIQGDATCLSKPLRQYPTNRYKVAVSSRVTVLSLLVNPSITHRLTHKRNPQHFMSPPRDSIVCYTSKGPSDLGALVAGNPHRWHLPHYCRLWWENEILEARAWDLRYELLQPFPLTVASCSQANIEWRFISKKEKLTKTRRNHNNHAAQIVLQSSRLYPLHTSR